MKLPKNWMVFYHKLANGLLITAMLFWLFETVAFTLIEGFHWRATSPAEQWCDMVVEMLFVGAMLCYLFALLDLLDEQVKLAQRTAFVESKPTDPDRPLDGVTDEDLVGYASYTMSVYKDGEITAINPFDIECKQWCGMSYCDDNGCLNRKRNYVDGADGQDAAIVNPKPKTE